MACRSWATSNTPGGFQHFDYVDTEAPKGGTVRLSAAGSFDSFNVVPAKGVVGAGIGYLYQSLMSAALDEASTQYGEIADAVRFPADFSSVTYRLNPKARWHDGKPITPDDVVWSFEVLKANNPQQAYYYKNVAKAEASGEHEVTFTFDKAGNRELPQIVGQLLVLPKHWWTGTDASGKARDITATTLEPPLGSGPYRIKSFSPGRSIVYGRVEDWWGADLPTAKGTYNLDEVRFEYFLDRDVMREAFKGDAFDFRVENIAKDWATSYDVPAVREGRIVRQEFPDASSGRMQAFAFNLRRREVRRPAREARLQRGVRLRGNEQDAVLRALHPHRLLFRGPRPRLVRPAAGPGARDPRERPRTRSRRRCSRRPTRTRSTAAMRSGAPIFATRSAFSRRPAGRCATAASSMLRRARP